MYWFYYWLLMMWQQHRAFSWFFSQTCSKSAVGSCQGLCFWALMPEEGTFAQPKCLHTQGLDIGVLGPNKSQSQCSKALRRYSYQDTHYSWPHIAVCRSSCLLGVQPQRNPSSWSSMHLLGPRLLQISRESLMWLCKTITCRRLQTIQYSKFSTFQSRFYLNTIRYNLCYILESASSPPNIALALSFTVPSLIVQYAVVRATVRCKVRLNFLIWLVKKNRV